MPRRLEALRVRLYPNPDQTSLLRRIWGSLRVLYNLALEQRSTFGPNGRRITSQTCGEFLRHPADDPATAHLLAGRISRDRFVCPLCGQQTNADHNTARVIRARGRQHWAA